MTTPAAATDDGARAVATLAGALRAAGVEVGTGQVVACARAMAELDHDDVVDRYWAGRACLVADPRDLPVYDVVFRALLLGAGERDADVGLPTPPEVSMVAASDRPPGDGGGPDDPAVAGAVASERERLRHRRFDRASAAELAVIHGLLARLHVAVPHRRVRRTRPGGRGELDLARTLDRALETDGELFDRAWRSRDRRPRRLVLLLDVSGSMAAHARALLRFALAARRTAHGDVSRRVEVFAFGTRLTRLTDALDDRDPDAAIVAAADRVVDWDGGTRIGDSLATLTRTWGRRGILRGAVVVVCSDGLERGDPDHLAREVARLRRHAYRVVWVNPLAGDPRFEPSQRGMAAALPHIDVFLPGHDLASLEGLADALATLR